ncbi:hypothetical protein LTR84_007038 [Exophiala bonariae]|uniref:Fungal N-terminal domain-containing protein n=1 Tax=Exophiala bonariae TaxID=1690606 RepID=A0AAV9N2Q4_9EURO|nr:hypothetical protein LTR84_007038 [Exophiala bonariae]
MATGVECAAAILGIIQFSVQMTDVSVRSYRSYRGAKKELQSLQQNVSTFSQTLHYFGQTMQGMFEKRLGPAKDPGFRRLMLEISVMVKGRMRGIQLNLRRVTALGNPRVSALSRVQARVLWVLFDGRDMKELFASLEPVKSTMNLVVGISNTQLFMEEIRQLQKDKVSISMEKFKQLEAHTAQISMLEKEVKEKQQQYESLLKLKTITPSNSLHSQANQVQLIREIVEHVQQLATERISDSASIVRDIASEEKLSAHTSNGSKSSTKSRTTHNPYNYHDRSYPSPPPRRREQGGNEDRVFSHRICRTKQDTNPVTIESARKPGEPVQEVHSSEEGIMPVEPSEVLATGSDDPTKNQSHTNPATVEIHHSPRELPPEEVDRNIQIQQSPPPLSPIHSQYRIVINRNGKMVTKKWRPAGDDSSSTASLSSSSL